MSAASGRFVTFLDDDDLYTADRLASAREALEDAPVVVCWRSGAKGLPHRERPLEGDVADIILDQMTPSLGQVAVARSLASPFDERLPALEDVDWLLRLARQAPFTTVPKLGYVVRQHSGPRVRHGTAARLSASRQLLETHAEYFARHPAAAAFRWKRIGLLAERLGSTGDARRAFWRSLRLHPEAATLWHLIRLLSVLRRDGVSLTPSTSSAGQEQGEQ